MVSSNDDRAVLFSDEPEARKPSWGWRRAVLALAGALLLVPIAAMAPAAATPGGSPFLAQFGTSSRITPTTEVASTVPANGDVNPYGLVEVTQSVGKLVAGDALVSNFNDMKNKQGTGNTIVEVSPSGRLATFATIDKNTLPGACPGGVGLTTALSVLPGGWVVVGSLPATGGLPANMQAGCLLVLNPMGHVVETFAGGFINGPWDMTSFATGSNTAELFVTNVLNGTVAGAGVADPNTETGNEVFEGTVVRLVLALSPTAPPSLTSSTVIATGFAEHTDPSALVVGPTGVAIGAGGILYVNDTAGNRIVSVANAHSRTSAADPGNVLTSGGKLNSPLGMTLAPNGDVLTVNGGNSRIVETTAAGQQVDSLDLGNPADPGTDLGAGSLFGVVVSLSGSSVLLVDDLNNFLDILG